MGSYLSDHRPKIPRRTGRLTSSLTTYARTLTCAHCERQCSDFAGGYSRGFNNEPLCHPNASNRPDCYRLVTLYQHETPCALKVCYEDHPDFMTYVETPNEKVPF